MKYHSCWFLLIFLGLLMGGCESPQSRFEQRTGNMVDLAPGVSFQEAPKLTFSSGGKVIALAYIRDAQGAVRLLVGDAGGLASYDPASGKRVTAFDTGGAGVLCLSQPAESAGLIAVGLNRGGEVRLFDYRSAGSNRSAVAVAIPGGGNRQAYSVALSSDGLTLIAGGDTDGLFHFWHRDSTGAPFSASGKYQSDGDDETDLYRNPVYGAVCVVPPGRAAMIGAGLAITFHVLPEGSEVRRFHTLHGEKKYNHSAVCAMALSPDQSQVVFGGSHDSGICVKPTSGNSKPIFVSWGWTGRSTSTGTSSFYAGKLLTFAFTPDSQRLFFCGDRSNGIFTEADNHSGKAVAVYAARGSSEVPVTAITVSPDGHQVAVGYQDGKVRLWSH